MSRFRLQPLHFIITSTLWGCFFDLHLFLRWPFPRRSFIHPSFQPLPLPHEVYLTPSLLFLITVAFTSPSLFILFPIEQSAWLKQSVLHHLHSSYTTQNITAILSDLISKPISTFVRPSDHILSRIDSRTKTFSLFQHIFLHRVPFYFHYWNGDNGWSSSPMITSYFPASFSISTKAYIHLYRWDPTVWEARTAISVPRYRASRQVLRINPAKNWTWMLTTSLPRVEKYSKRLSSIVFLWSCGHRDHFLTNSGGWCWKPCHLCHVLGKCSCLVSYEVYGSNGKTATPAATPIPIEHGTCISIASLHTTPNNSTPTIASIPHTNVTSSQPCTTGSPIFSIVVPHWFRSSSHFLTPDSPPHQMAIDKTILQGW